MYYLKWITLSIPMHYLSISSIDDISFITSTNIDIVGVEYRGEQKKEKRCDIFSKELNFLGFLLQPNIRKKTIIHSH